MPVVVSVTAGVVEPRYPSFKGIMAAKSKPVDMVSAADLGVAPVSWEQSITGVEQAPVREAGEVVDDDGEAYLKIVGFLEGLKVI
jgi:electron transfer flavoprotein beta subunit